MLNIKNFELHNLESVKDLLLKAFHNHPHGDPVRGVIEHLIVEELVQNKEDVATTVAYDGDNVVGFITYSKVQIDGTDNWLGLGPVAVLPDYQNKGIGKELIHKTLPMLKNDYDGCVVMGDPAYYTKFGFEVFDGLYFDGVPQQYFLAQTFKTGTAQGSVRYNKAFYM